MLTLLYQYINQVLKKHLKTRNSPKTLVSIITIQNKKQITEGNRQSKDELASFFRYNCLNVCLDIIIWVFFNAFKKIVLFNNLNLRQFLKARPNSDLTRVKLFGLQLLFKLNYFLICENLSHLLTNNCCCFADL